MGGFSSKNEQTFKVYLQREYDIVNYPFITHKFSKKKAIVHQLITDSTEQAQRINKDANLYRHLACKSISSILDYIPLESSKLCSQQEYHYIIEEDAQNYNLKDEFFARKYYKERFSHNEIISIIKTYLCALNVYHSQFARKFQGSIGMESIMVDESHSNHLRMIDPLLISEAEPHRNSSLCSGDSQELSTSSNKINNYVIEEQNSNRLAPQRRQIKKTRFNENKMEINQFLSDLYTVGIITLELQRMEQFDKHQKSETMLQQINYIQNQQLRRIITLLTASNPKQRASVYDILKVSSVEAYCLERSFKKGNVMKEHSRVANMNLQNPIKKQTSYSFGLSQHQVHPLTFTPNNVFPQLTSYPIHSNVNYLQRNNAFVMNQDKDLGFSKNKSVSFSHEKVQEEMKNYSFKQNQLILPLRLGQKSKHSNMSTERTLVRTVQNTSRSNYTIPITQRSSSRPIVKFNNSPSVHKLQTHHSSSHISFPTINQQSHHEMRIPVSLNSKDNETLKKRANSVFINEDKKTVFYESESPFRKQQIVGNLESRDQEVKDSFKQIFEKYSHLKCEQLSVSPNKTVENRKIEEEMNRLLNKSPNRILAGNINEKKQISKQVDNAFVKKFEITSSYTQVTKTSISNEGVKQSVNQNKTKQDIPIHNLSPIPQQQINDSPKITLQQTQPKTLRPKPHFMTQQKNITQNQNKIEPFSILPSRDIQTQHLPVYRPNKEVEEILKKLGIGSLLYGEEEKKQTKNTENQNIVNSQNQTNTQQYEEVFVHKGTYNIQNRANIQPVKNQIQKQQKFQQFEDRQTTPIRPANKNKYNSTIVEVGDEDSQYSSSGVRNTQKEIDLTDHQYVVEEYETGSRYEGYKLHGERNGEGKFFYQDGGYYEGHWKNNRMDGWGKLFYEGGKLAYQGNWCQDQFHGFGKVYNDNPLPLDCGFDFTNFDLLQDYWEYYEGMLVKDTKQGRGKIMLTNSQLFEGDFHNDRIQGFGKFFMKDGTVIQGIWRDSKLIKIITS